MIQRTSNAVDFVSCWPSTAVTRAYPEERFLCPATLSEVFWEEPKMLRAIQMARKDQGAEMIKTALACGP